MFNFSKLILYVDSNSFDLFLFFSIYVRTKKIKNMSSFDYICYFIWIFQCEIKLRNFSFLS